MLTNQRHQQYTQREGQTKDGIQRVERPNGRWLLKPRRCGTAAAGGGEMQVRVERDVPLSNPQVTVGGDTIG